MTAGSVPTTNLNAFYNNTTSGTPADPAKIDAAMQDIVQTVNDNYAAFAGFYQSDKVTNLGILNVKDYGAKGDGITDDTAAIQTALSTAADYSIIVIPSGNYKITAQLTASNKTGLTIICVGMLITYGCSALKLSDCNHCEVNVRLKNYDATNEFSTLGTMTASWALNYYGLQLTRVVASAIKANHIEGFNRAIFNDGDTGGTAYNTYHLGNIQNNKFDMYSRSVNGGYVTEFETIGGRFWLNSALKSVTSGTFGFYFEYPVSFNYTNIVLNKPAVETKHNFINIDNNKNLTMIAPRTEGTDQYIVCSTTNGAENITWIMGTGTSGSGLDLTKVNLNSNVKGFNILGAANDANGSVNKSIIMDTQAGGLSWINRYSTSQICNLYSSGPYEGQSLVHDDFFGRTQYFNKAYTSSANPSTGTWAKSSIAWNSSPTSGQPMGWVCSKSGTFGTLSGITGNTVSGSRTISNVSSTAGLKAGDYITSGGHSGSVYQIESIVDANTILLYGNAAYTETGATIQYSAPAFVTMPNFA